MQLIWVGKKQYGVFKIFSYYIREGIVFRWRESKNNFCCSQAAPVVVRVTALKILACEHSSARRGGCIRRL